MVDKKLMKSATLMFLIYVSIATIIGAAFTLYSNVVMVEVQYELVLTGELDFGGSAITLTANLTDYDGNPIDGVLIYFHNCSDSLGTIDQQIGTGWTGSPRPSGIAVLLYSVLDNGTHYFIATYEVP